MAIKKVMQIKRNELKAILFFLNRFQARRLREPEVYFFLLLNHKVAVIK